MAVIRCKGVGENTGKDSCMQKGLDENSGGHIVTIVIAYNCEGCYGHSLSFCREMLLSQLVISGAAIVIADDDK